MAFLHNGKSVGHGAATKAAKADCVEANPRLVMAVMAIGMIVGALLTNTPKASGSSATPPQAHASR